MRSGSSRREVSSSDSQYARPSGASSARSAAVARSRAGGPAARAAPGRAGSRRSGRGRRPCRRAARPARPASPATWVAPRPGRPQRRSARRLSPSRPPAVSTPVAVDPRRGSIVGQPRSAVNSGVGPRDSGRDCRPSAGLDSARILNPGGSGINNGTRSSRRTCADRAGRRPAPDGRAERPAEAESRRSPSMGISRDESQDARRPSGPATPPPGRHAAARPGGPLGRVPGDGPDGRRLAGQGRRRALRRPPRGRSPKSRSAEEESDREEVRIEQECLRILALYEPVASDLRRLATILKVNRDWERIADLAARIARRARKLARKSAGRPDPRAAQGARTRRARPGPRQLRRPGRPRRRGAPGPSSKDDRSIDRQYRRFRKELKEDLRLDAGQLNAWLQLIEHRAEPRADRRPRHRHRPDDRLPPGGDHHPAQDRVALFPDVNPLAPAGSRKNPMEDSRLKIQGTKFLNIITFSVYLNLQFSILNRLLRNFS